MRKLLLLCLIAITTAGQAAVLHVPGEFPDIQSAMDFAIDGDTILVAPGTYEIEGFDPIDFLGKAVLLTSEAGPTETLLVSDWPEPCIRFANGEGPGSVLDGFTVGSEYPEGGTGIRCEPGTAPTIRNMIFQNLYSWPDLGEGGAAIICDGASPRVSDTLFRDISSHSGAVALLFGSDAVFENVRFENNEGSNGGAVYIYQSSPTFTNVTFVDNEVRTQLIEDTYSEAHGGAVYCHYGSPLFESCLFACNSADNPMWPEPNSGGAVELRSSSAVFRQCTFYCNWSGDGFEGEPTGGSFYCRENSDPVLDRVIVSFSDEGGGILCDSPISAPVLSCCDVYGNVDGNFLGMDDPTGTDGNISMDPFYCDADNGDFTVAANSPCLPPYNPCGAQIGAYGEGCEGVTNAAGQVPGVFHLGQAYPNPFNPHATIAFELPDPAAVSLAIYDVSGRLARELVIDEDYSGGRHEVTWRGLDDAGRPLPSGVYFFRMDAGQFAASRKLVLLR